MKLGREVKEKLRADKELEMKREQEFQALEASMLAKNMTQARGINREQVESLKFPTVVLHGIAQYPRNPSMQFDL